MLRSAKTHELYYLFYSKPIAVVSLSDIYFDQIISSMNQCSITHVGEIHNKNGRARTCH